MTPVQSRFAYWVDERESIRIKKEAGREAPWTDDSILQTYRFCNIRREDDRVTRWIRKNVQFRNSRAHLLAMTFCRLYNKVETLNAIGSAINWPTGDMKGDQRWVHDATSLILEMQEEGKSVWSNAYMITTTGHTGLKAVHLENVFLNIIQRTNTITDEKLLVTVCARLCEIPMISTFYAGQIIADLKNTKGTWLNYATDFQSWCTPGPGSRRGLKRFFQDQLPDRNFIECVSQVRLIASRVSRHVLSLDHQDIQNCLCEFDKYERVYGGGRYRRRYQYDDNSRLHPSVGRTAAHANTSERQRELDSVETRTSQNAG